MTPAAQAAALCRQRGREDFGAMVERHMLTGYVWASPECFILALPGWRVDSEYFEECREGDALWITLAVGEIGQFLRMDPQPEGRRWLGFSRGLRDPGAAAHWLDYQRVRMHYRRHHENH